MTDFESCVRIEATVLNERLAEIGGCGDSSCLVYRPIGMATNGGCRCWSDRYKMQKVLMAYLIYSKRIAALVAEVEDD